MAPPSADEWEVVGAQGGPLLRRQVRISGGFPGVEVGVGVEEAQGRR